MSQRQQHGRRLDSTGRSGREDSSGRPAKSRRIRLACQRCQTRKIKCDNLTPKCSACQKAGTDCVNGKTVTHEGIVSRGEAASLREQIQQLEEVLRSREKSVLAVNVVDSHEPYPLQNRQSSIVIEQPQNHAQAVTNELDYLTPHGTLRNDQAQDQARDSNEVAHEIGLIPLSAGINKYVGPSSGFPFAKLLFARADQTGLSPETTFTSTGQPGQNLLSTNSQYTFSIPPSQLPTSVDQAVQLSGVYFRNVHFQYPFLHEPSFNRMLQQVYQQQENAARISRFQVTMVLAISAIVLSRRIRIPFTGEGLCAAAMENVNKIDLHNSIQGVQCLLLIAIFTLHSSYLSVNPWYINYQCLAIVLDLGLQRDVPLSATMTSFEKEMRTRIFWVIYSLDRTLATTLGRPIGLRDEACDLRLPLGLDDKNMDASTGDVFPRDGSVQERSLMVYSTIFFRLAQLNSEIKYILHSVTRNTPKYTYPQITDTHMWQNDVWQRLETVRDSIPGFPAEERALSDMCQIRFQEITMLLFRPTPRIKTPTKESLNHCYRSAKTTIGLWKRLYENDMMSYSWITINSVCMSAITLLYCIWTSSEIAATSQIDVLTSIMRDSSNLLSAAGEHWTEARRSRSSLDGLTMATIRWLLDAQSRSRPVPDLSDNRNSMQAMGTAQRISTRSSGLATQPSSMTFASTQLSDFDASTIDFAGLDTYINSEDLAAFVGVPDLLTNNFVETMDGMFSEYQPLFDFGPPTDMGMSFLG